MTIQDLLDAPYIVPMLIQHFDNPTEATTAIMQKYDIDVDEAKKIRHLLEYHKWFTSDKGPNYPLLRIGLNEYFRQYLRDIFKDIGIPSEKLFMLDYGCGGGQYAEQFIKENKVGGRVLAVDREDVIQNYHPTSKRISKMVADFEKEPKWYVPYKDTFDLVLLSEVLHCKDRMRQDYLIISSMAMLKKGGKLIINENLDWAMQWRISKIKGETIPLVTAGTLARLIPVGLKLINVATINNHQIFLYEKL